MGASTSQHFPTLTTTAMDSTLHSQSPRPYREIRAQHDADTITVYQAYNAEIASAAVAAGTFVAPFRRTRMTWVKPSFLWMMYRAGWGAKDAGQARVLAIRVRRAAFERALAEARLSHFDKRVHGDVRREEWERQGKEERPDIVVQWDPERDCHGRALGWRSLQVGLRGGAVDRYVDEWIVGIEDVTEMCEEIKKLVDEGREEEAYARMPQETPVEVPKELIRTLGMLNDADVGNVDEGDSVQ